MRGRSVGFTVTSCYAHSKFKTCRFALGPKNVHQPWPLALNFFKVEQNPKSIKLKEAKTIEAATLNLAIS